MLDVSFKIGIEELDGGAVGDGISVVKDGGAIGDSISIVEGCEALVLGVKLEDEFLGFCGQSRLLFLE